MRIRRRRLWFAAVIAACFLSVSAFVLTRRTDASRALLCLRPGMTEQEARSAMGGHFFGSTWTNYGTYTRFELLWQFDDSTKIQLDFKDDELCEAVILDADLAVTIRSWIYNRIGYSPW